MQFWYDFASTYSYPAAMTVEQAARGRGVAIEWRAFLLGAIFKDRGLNDSPFNLDPVKGRYMWRDVERICRREGLTWRRPSAFPRRSLLPARIACWYRHESWVPEFTRRVFLANFADDRDIGEATVIGGILESLGLDRELLDIAGRPEAKARLRGQTGEAKSLGLFGAPTFVVGNELFWGGDRLEDALDCSASRDGA